MEYMLLSAGGTEFVHWWEVVSSLECPLLEVPLYSYVLISIVGLLLYVSVMELPPNVMERGRGCCAGSVLLLKYYLLLHESRMMSE